MVKSHTYSSIFNCLHLAHRCYEQPPLKWASPMVTQHDGMCEAPMGHTTPLIKSKTLLHNMQPRLRRLHVNTPSSSKHWLKMTDGSPSCEHASTISAAKRQNAKITLEDYTITKATHPMPDDKGPVTADVECAVRHFKVEETSPYFIL